jgi:hypothetical protein
MTHRDAASIGISVMEHDPLGRGLSTAAGGGQLVANRTTTTATTSVLVTESQYLQVGTQIGVAGLALYLGLVLLLLRHLMRRGASADANVRALATAVAATAVGVVFLQPFTDPEVAWTFWGVAGLAAGVADSLGGCTLLASAPVAWAFDEVGAGSGPSDDSVAMSGAAQRGQNLTKGGDRDAMVPQSPAAWPLSYAERPETRS